jgi:hypothetical protein
LLLLDGFVLEIIALGSFYYVAKKGLLFGSETFLNVEDIHVLDAQV